MTPAPATATRRRGMSDHEKVDEFVHRRCCERSGVERDVEYPLLLFLGEAPGEVGPEFIDQQRNAVLAPSAMPYGIFDHDFTGLVAVVEFDGNGVGDGALVG